MTIFDLSVMGAASSSEPGRTSCSIATGIPTELEGRTGASAPPDVRPSTTSARQTTSAGAIFWKMGIQFRRCVTVPIAMQNAERLTTKQSKDSAQPRGRTKDFSHRLKQIDTDDIQP